jgi:hypothetical protein
VREQLGTDAVGHVHVVEPHRGAGLDLGAHPYPAARRRVLHRGEQQVGEHLLEAYGIGDDRQ